MSVHFQSIPTSDLEIINDNIPTIISAATTTPTSKINKIPDYPHCFPADIWRFIIKYLSFIQITHLAQCNRFLYSFCRPILKKFTTKGAIYIKLTAKKMNVQFVETDIQTMTPTKILQTLLYEIDCRHRFPASEIFLEQDPTFFSNPWQLYWNSLFRHISPGTQFLKELSLRNLHCSKSEFLRFVIPCGRLKKLFLENCNFNEYIFIEADLYDQNSSLRIIQISQCPDIICDKNSKKYFLKTLQFSEKNIYDRKNASYRESRNQIPLKTIHNFEKIGFNFLQILSIIFPSFHCSFLWLFYLSKFNQEFYHFFVVLPIFLFITATFVLRFSPMYYSSKFHFFHKIECFIQTSIFTSMSATQILFSYIFYAVAFFFLIGIYVPLAFQSSAILTFDKLLSLSIVAFVIILCGIFMISSWFWSIMERFIETHISCM